LASICSNISVSAALVQQEESDAHAGAVAGIQKTPRVVESSRVERSSPKKSEPISIFKANRRRTSSDDAAAQQDMAGVVARKDVPAGTNTEMTPFVVYFGSTESSPAALTINANGCGWVRWSKKGSVACSLEDGRLFAAHRNGSIAAILDSGGHGSVSSPRGLCVLAMDSDRATIYDTKGSVVKEIRRQDYDRDIIDGEEYEMSCTGITKWTFDGLVIEFLPRVWDLIVSVSNERIDCQFSSVTGGRVLKVKDIEKVKRTQRTGDGNVDSLALYDHEVVRSSLLTVVSNLDAIMGNLKR
jgi:hypothetical protein